MKKTTSEPVVPSGVIVCPNTQKPCLLSAQLSNAIEDLRRRVAQSVFLGAMIGAGVGSALKDIIRGLL